METQVLDGDINLDALKESHLEAVGRLETQHASMIGGMKSEHTAEIAGYIETVGRLESRISDLEATNRDLVSRIVELSAPPVVEVEAVGRSEGGVE